MTPSCSPESSDHRPSSFLIHPPSPGSCPPARCPWSLFFLVGSSWILLFFCFMLWASAVPPPDPPDTRYPATQDLPGEQRPILWAPKWVDYSSKYGFGYQLSDGGSGVLLRDGTHMALRPPGE